MTFITHKWIFHHYRDTFLGDVVGSRTQAANCYDDVGACNGHGNTLLESLYVVAHGLAAVQIDSKLRKPFSNISRVGVSGLPQEKFSPDSNYFSIHSMVTRGLVKVAPAQLFVDE